MAGTTGSRAAGTGPKPPSVDPATHPMEALLVDDLPTGGGWQYEPKWDGFRCIAFRDGEQVELMGKSGKSLARYFPEVVANLDSLRRRRFVIDGELVIRVGDSLSFDALQMRLHPAESRIRRLAKETPATFILFDCLMSARGASLLAAPLEKRRAALEEFFASAGGAKGLGLSPATVDEGLARRWLAEGDNSLDGVVAKRLDEPYQPGKRAMFKVKRMRTADCVVGGFRYASSERLVGSLLLGLYDASGRLNHVGFTSGFAGLDRADLTRKLERLIAPPGFTGDAPGGPSRWSTERSGEWQPLKPKLVAEVRYDHVTGGRFRHGTRFLRWRPDKPPGSCTFDQIEPPVRSGLIAALHG